MYSLCTCMYNIFCTSIRFLVGLCTIMSEICYAPCILSVPCKVPPMCTFGTLQVGSILVTNIFSCNHFGGILYLPITALSFIMHHFYMYVLYVVLEGCPSSEVCVTSICGSTSFPLFMQSAAYSVIQKASDLLAYNSISHFQLCRAHHTYITFIS
jgi:hypothetical protein